MELRPFAPDWAGLTAVVIGNGNSVLTLGGTFRRIKAMPWRTLISNSGFEFFPDADVLMCADRRWLPLNPDLRAFKGGEVIVTRPEAVARHDARMRHVPKGSLERMVRAGNPFGDPGVLAEGFNSTTTNISQCVLRGAARILLLGIDLAPGNRGRRSAYNPAVDPLERAVVRYAKQVEHLTLQAEAIARHCPGVEVWNCSPPSALTCYPYASIEYFLDSRPTGVA